MSVHKEIQKSSEMKFDGKLIKVTYDVADVNGKEAWREVVHHPGASAIVVVDDHNRIVMERQYRYAIDYGLLEVPAGKLDGNEDPLECAKRELEEETGMTTKSVKKISEFYTAPGFCNEKIYLYKADNLTKVDKPRPHDDDEVLECHEVTLAEAKALIQKGEISDAKTILAIQYWELETHA